MDLQNETAKARFARIELAVGAMVKGANAVRLAAAASLRRCEVLDAALVDLLRDDLAPGLDRAEVRRILVDARQSARVLREAAGPRA